MKTLKMIMVMIMLVMVSSVTAMPHRDARREASFLTDRMNSELQLSRLQYDAIYRANLDYLLSVDNRHDVYGHYWKERNHAIKRALTSRQYRIFKSEHELYYPVVLHETRTRHFGSLDAKRVPKKIIVSEVYFGGHR